MTPHNLVEVTSNNNNNNNNNNNKSNTNRALFIIY